VPVVANRRLVRARTFRRLHVLLRRRHDTPMAVDHVLLVDPAEPDPVLDALPEPR
jgi:hypothetical protein